MTFNPRSLVLSAALLVSISVAFAQAPDAKPVQPPARPVFHLLPLGQAAPDFTAFTPDGEKVTLSQFKGKVVILDFWASWCAPCQRSMPGLEEIYQQIKDKDFVVLSLDTWDQKPDFEAWTKKNSGSKYHFNFVRDPAEGDHDAIRKASIAKRLYAVPVIPTMYIIDRDGKISDYFVGSGNDAGIAKALGKVGFSVAAPTGNR